MSMEKSKVVVIRGYNSFVFGEDIFLTIKAFNKQANHYGKFDAQCSVDVLEGTKDDIDNEVKVEHAMGTLSWPKTVTHIKVQ